MKERMGEMGENQRKEMNVNERFFSPSGENKKQKEV